jgi:plastocyanin domain-containing protein
MVHARVSSLLFVGMLTLGACGKSGTQEQPKGAKEAAVTTGNVSPDGVRRVEVDAGKDGYVPARILAQPGEKLVLVFTRTVEGACLAELKTPDGALVQLEMNKPVEIAVTAPTSGELAFACGMDMFRGAIVAQPAG